MRRILHLSVVVALVFAFWQSSFEHRHSRDPHHKHVKGLRHAHWVEVTHRHGAAFARPNHGSDAYLLDWFAGDGSSIVRFVPKLSAAPIAPTLPVHVESCREFVSHNHDPPSRGSLCPRAPPA